MVLYFLYKNNKLNNNKLNNINFYLKLQYNNIIQMLDLYNNKYDRQTLKDNIYAISLIDILKTQNLDVTFVVRYILNKNYQINDKDNIISVPVVLYFQQHIKYEELQIALNDYESDDDSIADFETVSNQSSKKVIAK